MLKIFKRIESAVGRNIIKTKVLLPDTFFVVHEEPTPKASPPLLYSTAGVGYAIVIAAFIALLITQSRIYTLETTIELSDISSSTYSCKMASIVTKAVTYNSTTSYSSSVAFSQINELGSECRQDLQALSPCSSVENFVYEPSDFKAVPYFVDGASSQPRNNIFHALLSPQFGSSFQRQAGRFDLNTGTFKGSTNATLLSADSVVTDANGEGFFYNSANGCVYAFSTAAIVSCDGAFTINNNCTTQKLISDDSGNIYFLCETDESVTIRPLLFTGEELTIEIFNITQHEFIGMYNDGGAASDRKSLCYRKGYTVFKTFSDSLNETHAVLSLPGWYEELTDVILLDAKQKFVVVGHWIFPPAQEIFVIELQSGVATNPVLSSTDKISYDLNSLFLLEDSIVIAAVDVIPKFQSYQISTKITEDLHSSWAGTRTGWFACGRQMLKDAGLPSDPSSLPSFCDRNGIMWTYTSKNGLEGLLSASKAKEIILKQAQKECLQSNVIPSIATTVGNLPPYICTRRVYQSVFSVMSTALANATALMGILFFLIGFVLPHLNRCFSGKEDTYKKTTLPRRAFDGKVYADLEANSENSLHHGHSEK
jgi:hypothetical protein